MVIAAHQADTITGEHVPADIATPADRTDPAGAAASALAGSNNATFQELKAEAERQIVLASLHRHDWHITETAAALGLADHASLLKIMRRHGISRETEGGPG
jgi:DNA-binding NtrC family response regulator